MAERMKSIQIAFRAWRIIKQAALDEQKTIGEAVAEAIYYRYGEG